MKLLEAEPQISPGAPAAPGDAPREAAPVAEAPAPARTCEACGAAMAADQDWCLDCGTAAPGRLGARPGWRAAMTVLALTLALVAGSVAAAYAALTSDATQEAASAPPPAADAIAQAPPATPPSTAQPPAPKTTVPKVDAGATGTTTGGSVTPIPPGAGTTTTPGTSTGATTPSFSAGSGTTGSGSGSTGSGSTGSGTSTGSSTSPGTSTDETPDGPASTTTKPAAPTAIDLPSSAGALYDPFGKAAEPGDPAKALDGDESTAFSVGTSGGSWAVGYVIDAQKVRGLREVDLATSTPGFKVEVYATDEATPPPDISDTRWAHLKDRSDVGSGGDTERIVLGSGETSKYRTLLLWITQGPSEGDRVRLDEVTVLG